MNVATQRVEVGVRDLKNNLSRHLASVKDGAEITVTEHGRPVARLIAIDASTDRLAQLIEAGVVRPPRTTVRSVPEPINPAGTISDLVADQRR
ncbi:MAG: type II toxin-antitoxin system prevent-host-death family antitoxin [Candidatus Microthrix subdominans]